MKKLIAKKALTLKEHLENALKNDEIKTSYQFSESKRKDETDDDYIGRLKEESAKYQFVEVTEEDDKKNEYVSFGNEAPIILKGGVLESIPAKVVDGNWGVHHLMAYPDFETLLKSDVIPVRIDSGCFSGMVLGDITCDCLEQLRNFQKQIIEGGLGLIIEIPKHDGRGWGEFKMANQKIMHELKLDTIDTAQKFYGHKDNIDIRTYDEAGTILRGLGFKLGQKFILGTANPFKVKGMEDNGFVITESKPVKIGEESYQGKLKSNIESKNKYWYGEDK